jgi:hypothetical protein
VHIVSEELGSDLQQEIEEGDPAKEHAGIHPEGDLVVQLPAGKPLHHIFNISLGGSCRARREEVIPRPLGVDYLGADLLELPVAGERECDLVPAAAEVLRVVALPEEHADVGPFILQGVDKVHEVGFDTATVAVLPVICDKCNLHHDLIPKSARTHP